MEPMSVGVRTPADLVAAVPGLVKRVPHDGEVVIVWLRGNRVESAAIAEAPDLNAAWVMTQFAACEATTMLGVSFDVDEDDADHLTAEMGSISERFADWYVVEGRLVYSMRTGTTLATKPWQESELTAALAYHGEVIAPDRAAIEAEVKPNDQVLTPEQARLIESLDDVDVRDRHLYEWTKVADADLPPLVEEVAESARRYPSASAATVAALGYMLTGDMMRSTLWAQRALEIDINYQMALLTLGLLSKHTGPEQAKALFASIYDNE